MKDNTEEKLIADDTKAQQVLDKIKIFLEGVKKYNSDDNLRDFFDIFVLNSKPVDDLIDEAKKHLNPQQLGKVLSDSCSYGNWILAEKLLDLRPDVTHTSEDGHTPLYYAVMAKKPDLVEKLCNLGANIQTKSGKSPLEIAFKNKADAIVDVLIKKGCKTLFADQLDEVIKNLLVHHKGDLVKFVLEKTPHDVLKGKLDKYLHQATLYGEDDVVKVIIERGGDHLAALQQKVMFKDLKEGDEFFAKDHQNNWYKSSLLKRNNNELYIHYIGWPSKWDEWIDIDQESKRFFLDSLDRVRALLGLALELWKCEDISAADGKNLFLEMIDKFPFLSNIIFNLNGETALHLACKAGNVEIVRELIKSGADICANDKNGHTPMVVACHNGHDDCVQAFPNLRNNPEISKKAQYGWGLLIFARANKTKALEALAEKCVLVGWHFPDNGYFAIHHAVSHDDTAMIQALNRAKDFHINEKHYDSSKNHDFFPMPLHLAIYQGKLKALVQLLLHPRINVNARWRNDTPLQLAACSEKAAQITFFLKNHKVISRLQTIYRNVAISDNDVDTIRFLIQCHLNYKNNIEMEIDTQDTHQISNYHKTLRVYIEDVGGRWWRGFKKDEEDYLLKIEQKLKAMLNIEQDSKLSEGLKPNESPRFSKSHVTLFKQCDDDYDDYDESKDIELQPLVRTKF